MSFSLCCSIFDDSLSQICVVYICYPLEYRKPVSDWEEWGEEIEERNLKDRGDQISRTKKIYNLKIRPQAGD